MVLYMCSSAPVVAEVSAAMEAAIAARGWFRTARSRRRGIVAELATATDSSTIQRPIMLAFARNRGQRWRCRASRTQSPAVESSARRSDAEAGNGEGFFRRGVRWAGASRGMLRRRRSEARDAGRRA
jgi:hypothetical protein